MYTESPEGAPMTFSDNCATKKHGADYQSEHKPKHLAHLFTNPSFAGNNRAGTIVGTLERVRCYGRHR